MARSSGSSAGVIVTGLTVAALSVIGFFAFQANAAQERADERKASASPAPAPSSSSDPKGGKTALPPHSGQGERVVYSLGRERVWLVGANGKPEETYRVEPGSVDPRPGGYRVTSRASHVTGTDGIPIENVVRFTTTGNTTIGFSSALDGSMPEADPSKETGGIREHRKDGETMWLFATIGTKVVVVG